MRRGAIEAIFTACGCQQLEAHTDGEEENYIGGDHNDDTLVCRDEFARGSELTMMMMMMMMMMQMKMMMMMMKMMMMMMMMMMLKRMRN